MVFEVFSKFDKGDTVIVNKDKQLVKVIDIDLKQRLYDLSYQVQYLVEFPNKERLWITEGEIAECGC